MDDLANWLKISEEELMKYVINYINFKFLKEAMEHYVEFYLEKINDLYEEGFALAVIAEMTRNVLDEDEIRCLMRKRGYLI